MGLEPRDISTYLADLINSKEQIDPALDVRKGPLSVMLYMAAVEGVRTENLATYLRRLYQLTDPSLIDDDDIFQLGQNFGKDPNIARPSEVTVTFYRLSRPEAGTLYTVPEGTLVSTSDNRFAYAVEDEQTMNGDLADSYYDASRGWYGLNVRCLAVAVGTDYNLPPETINTIITTQENFDGCLNLNYADRGTDPLDKFQFRDIIWAAQRGLNQNIIGNFRSLIDDLDPTGYDDMSIIPSTETAYYQRYGRVQGKLGYDIYLITDSLTEESMSGVADGGEFSLLLDKRPVNSVVSVYVDGSAVAFSLDLDQDPRITGSPRALDRVQLAAPLQPGQAYEIRYLYYDLVYNFNELLSGRASPFGADVLVRLANRVEVYVAGTVQTFTTAEPEEVINDIITFTQGYFRDPENPGTDTRSFVTTLDPSDYQKEIEASVDGVVNFRLTRFAREDDATLPIERISFDGRTTYPVLSVNSLFT